MNAKTKMDSNPRLSKIYLLICVCVFCTTSAANGKPNVVIIMADDLGFDDVSFRGSDRFLTPNIDALAYNGIILNNLYTAAMCTPSRAALLTGKYPINTGMQHYVIVNDEPWGLPVEETTMAQIFQQHGYYTSLIGKWHLGMARKAYTPTLRGFDHHLGYLGSYIDYYDQAYYATNKNYSRGHDFRLNLKPIHKHSGQYVTDLLSDAAVELIERHNTTEKPLFLLLSHLAPHAANSNNPMQAPPEELEKFSYITRKTRRAYAAMVSRLDRSVGQVIDALGKKQLLNNTIILFLSDNGGPTLGEHATTASNYPLRGQKNSPWEGGIRSSAAIWSTEFEKLGSVWNQRFYIGDILPTLAAAADIPLDKSLKLDGLNLWSALKYGYESVEREIVHNIDDGKPAFFSFTKGKWKLVNGTTEKGVYDNWLGRRYTTEYDPRSDDYEELIKNTTVWQHLQKYRLVNETDISTLRIAAAIKCQFTMGTLGEDCNPLTDLCLFDLDADPCEQNNLIEDHRAVVNDLLERVSKFRKNAQKPNNKRVDPNCDPRYYKYEWTWWLEEPKSSTANKLSMLNQYLYGLLAVGYMFIYM